MRGLWRIALVLAVLFGRATCSWALEQAIDNPVLCHFNVGGRIQPTGAALAAFAVVEVGKPAEDKAGKTVTRFELFQGDTLYFVEVGDADKSVASVGWTKTCAYGEIDALAGALLGGYSRQFGFPDDVISDTEIQAVGWTDEKKGLRFEILKQPVDEEPSQVDLTVVLRKQ